MRSAILSFERVEKLHPGRFTYPMSTAQVIDQLDKRGVWISNPNAERLIRIHELVVPTIGRTRAWGAEQVESLIDCIVRDAAEPANKSDQPHSPAHTQIPSWMKMHAAKFLTLGIGADEWFDKHMAFEAAHPELSHDERGHHIYRPWYAIPTGAKLIMHENSAGNVVFAFEPIDPIAFEPEAPKPQAKKAAVKKGKK